MYLLQLEMARNHRRTEKERERERETQKQRLDIMNTIDEVCREAAMCEATLSHTLLTTTRFLLLVAHDSATTHDASPIVAALAHALRRRVLAHSQHLGLSWLKRSQATAGAQHAKGTRVGASPPTFSFLQSKSGDETLRW